MHNAKLTLLMSTFAVTTIYNYDLTKTLATQLSVLLKYVRSPTNKNYGYAHEPVGLLHDQPRGAAVVK